MFRYKAKVMRVIDGDTFETEDQIIRLAKIDAPEINEYRGLMGLKATNFLRSLIHGRIVYIRQCRPSKDYYNRIVADVWRTTDNLHVNKAMVDAGYAKWHESSEQEVMRAGRLEI